MWAARSLLMSWQAGPRHPSLVGGGAPVQTVDVRSSAEQQSATSLRLSVIHPFLYLHLYSYPMPSPARVCLQSIAGEGRRPPMGDRPPRAPREGGFGGRDGYRSGPREGGGFGRGGGGDKVRGSCGQCCRQH